MKKIIIALFIVLVFFGISRADYYVVNQDNKVIVRCNYIPDKADLEKRKEIVVYTAEDIALPDAEYRGGKIVKHVKTTAEAKQEQAEAAKQAEDKKIQARARKLAIDSLNAEGLFINATELN
jgi:hypothetical protein